MSAAQLLIRACTLLVIAGCLLAAVTWLFLDVVPPKWFGVNVLLLACVGVWHLEPKVEK